MSDSTDSVFSKVFAHLPSSLREENLGYEHSAPLGHLKHEPTPAVEYTRNLGLMLKNGSFKDRSWILGGFFANVFSLSGASIEYGNLPSIIILC